jgi:hypothetical protein
MCSLSPEAARVAARAARLSPPQRPSSAAPSLSGSSPSTDGSPASTRGSGATCYSDFSSDGEEWAEVAGAPAAGVLASAADDRDVSRWATSQRRAMAGHVYMFTHECAFRALLQRIKTKDMLALAPPNRAKLLMSIRHMLLHLVQEAGAGGHGP